MMLFRRINSMDRFSNAAVILAPSATTAAAAESRGERIFRVLGGGRRGGTFAHDDLKAFFQIIGYNFGIHSIAHADADLDGSDIVAVFHPDHPTCSCCSTCSRRCFVGGCTIASMRWT